MPTERLSMRRIRRVLELHFSARISARLIAREVGVGRSTVQDYVARATGANLGWPLPPDLSDATLEELLFPKQVAMAACDMAPTLTTCRVRTHGSNRSGCRSAGISPKSDISDLRGGGPVNCTGERPLQCG